MKKYELITELEVTPDKSNKLIDDFLNYFNNWDEYKDEFIGNKQVKIEKDSNKWDKEYLRKHISLLSINFSKERLKHIKEIIEYLYVEEKKTEIYTKKKLIIVVVVLLLMSLIFIIVEQIKYAQTVMMDQNQTEMKEQK